MFSRSTAIRLQSMRRRIQCTLLLILCGLTPYSVYADEVDDPLVIESSCEGVSPGKLERCMLVESGIRANLEGHYGEADIIWEKLRRLDPKDPVPDIWAAETAWWRLVLDDGMSSQDVLIQKATDRAIRLANAKLKIDDEDAVAVGAKGMALMMQARLNGLRGRYLAAGRAGEKGRVLLEQAVMLNPDRRETLFPLAVYYYYAGVAPSFVKWVSWLWFVPKGDRKKGLALLSELQAGQGPRADEARFMLMVVNTYHAPMNFSSALASGRLLHERYPENILFQSELVEVMLKEGLYEEAIETALALEAQAPSDSAARSRLMLARILRAQGTLLMGNSDQAEAILNSVDEEQALLPAWGGAWLHLVRAQLLDARGERQQALVEYAFVIDLKGPSYNERAALIAKAGMVSPFDPAEYRESPMIDIGPL